LFSWRPEQSAALIVLEDLVLGHCASEEIYCVRIARIMAFLLAVATIGVSAYYYMQAPVLLPSVLPAVAGVIISLYFWRTAPAKKKERRRAAAASLFVVPCILASAIVSLFFSPVSVWPVYLCLAALAVMLAVFALQRVKKKQSHPWADYYQEIA
jgi:hypothetical protein